MADILVACPSCHGLNRVQGQRMSEGPVCGKCKSALLPGTPVDLDEAAFVKHVYKSNLPVVVDFWSQSCGPCRMMAPAFAEAAKKLPTVRFAKVLTDTQVQLAGQFNIKGVPTLIFFKNGQEINRQSGAMDATSIATWVQQSLMSTI